VIGTRAPRAEKRQDREDPTVLVPVLVEPELGEDAADMGLDRFELNKELLGDRAVRPALGHQREDLHLPWGELVEKVFSMRATERG